MYALFGLGNAITDTLVRLPDDSVLQGLDLVRGTMHLVDDAAWTRAFGEVSSKYQVDLAPGGSCANTVSTAALLGTQACYCGMVGTDDFGQSYQQSMKRRASLALVENDSGNTGRCLSLISPDGERTMLTDLGCSMHLEAGQLPSKAMQGARLLHTTGYLLTGSPMREAAFRALDLAQEAGMLISFDVADPFVVSVFGDDVRKVINDYADIVFMNEMEAESLTGKKGEEAFGSLPDRVSLAVVKLGARGSLLRHGGQTVRIEATRVDAIDTTGAGDAYAGGMLHGLLSAYPSGEELTARLRAGDIDEAKLQSWGRIASLVAGQTVAQVGGVVEDGARLRSIALA